MLVFGKWRNVFLSFVLVVGMASSAEANYPVRDTSNILTNAKNVAETIKVVTETTKMALDTAQQVQNGLKDLAKFPDDLMQASVNVMKSITSNVNNTIRDVTDPKKYAKELFPGIPSAEQLKQYKDSFEKQLKNGTFVDVKIEVQELKEAEDTKVLNARKKTEEGIKKIEEENKKGEEELRKLAERARTAQGQDEILGIKIAMTGVKANIEANNQQKQYMKDQLKIVEDEATINKARIEVQGQETSNKAESPFKDFLYGDLQTKTGYNESFGRPEGEKPFWK